MKHRHLSLPVYLLLPALLAITTQFGLASTLKVSLDSATRLPTEVEADYTVSHTILNEVQGQKTLITFFCDPQILELESVELYTNLNRREFANRDANGDGVPDGIEPPPGNSIAASDDSNYYKAYLMGLIPGGYALTLTAPQDRGGFADLAAGLPAGALPAFNLSYLKALGCNTIWLQPIHPRGIDGRENDPLTNQPYALGSPYSVRNFFSVMPLLAKSFSPGSTPGANERVGRRRFRPAIRRWNGP